MKIFRLKPLGTALRNACTLLVKNDPLRLAGATAFFSTFALPPILLIMIQVLSLLFNRRAISRRLFDQLGGIVGADSVHQLVSTLRAFRGLAVNPAIAIGGFVFLIFVATTLFKVIQSSINQLWMIRGTGKANFRVALLNRVKSFLVILFTGSLFLFAVLLEGIQGILGKYAEDILPGTGFVFDKSVAFALSIITGSIWFAVVFRYLPAGKPGWKVAFTGAFLTSILFYAGKFILKWLLPNSNIGVVYGTSGSVVLLLLFVFYSSIILYYGAAFTKTWGIECGKPITPLHDAGYYDYANTQPVG